MDDTSLILLSPAMLAKLDAMAQGVADLQDVIGQTAAIENAVRRFAFFTPRDRNPLTVWIASNAFSPDPAVPGADLVADGSELMLAEYEIPEHRVGEVYHIDGFARVVVALGAAQALSLFVRVVPPGGAAARTMRMQNLLANVAGTNISISITGSNWFMPRWKVQVVASLTAGAGAARAHGSIGSLEYNLGGA